MTDHSPFCKGSAPQEGWIYSPLVRGVPEGRGISSRFSTWSARKRKELLFFHFSFFIFTLLAMPAFVHAANVSVIPGPNPGNSPTSIIGNFISFAIMASGLLAVGAIVAGAVMYAASGGNTSTQGNARELIKNAVMGILLLAGSYVILNTINPELTVIKLPTLEKLIPLVDVDVDVDRSGEAPWDASSRFACLKSGSATEIDECYSGESQLEAQNKCQGECGTSCIIATKTECDAGKITEQPMGKVFAVVNVQVQKSYPDEASCKSECSSSGFVCTKRDETATPWKCEKNKALPDGACSETLSDCLAKKSDLEKTNPAKTYSCVKVSTNFSDWCSGADTTSDCPGVPSLTPLTGDAMQLELIANGPASCSVVMKSSYDANVNRNLVKLNQELTKMKNALKTRGADMTVNSVYRPLSYQSHLREIVDRKKVLTGDQRPACQSFKTKIDAEITKHCLGTVVSVGSSCAPHVLGIGVDIDLEGIDYLEINKFLSENGIGLKWQMLKNDEVHFNLKNPPYDPC